METKLYPMYGCVANAKGLALFGAGNIARTRMNSGLEQKQFRLYLFGSRYLQHNRRKVRLRFGSPPDSAENRFPQRIRMRV
jgi:hypothetical protein